MNHSPAGDPTAVWAFGKVDQGWYMARWLWNREYAKHLESLGYKVMRSIKKPEVAA